MWLVKTEPSSYSWDDLVSEGRTVWDGVKNPAALKQMAAMKKGDAVFVYHTGGEKAVVGVGRVDKGPYPDPALGDPRRLVFDLAAGKPLTRPVTLSELRSQPAFSGSPLVRQGRLSVLSITPPQWKVIETLARSNP